jgi:alanine racemase
VSGPLATIDGASLRHNLGIVRRLAPSSRVLAVIKADAYGHGLVGTAKVLSNADAFGVARLSEALSLRSAGIAHAIVLLEGVASGEELYDAAKNRLELVVHSFEQVEMLEQSSATDAFDIWLKIDTGMNRLGFRPEDFPEALRRLQACRTQMSLRLMTHLATGEEPMGATTQTQIEIFNALSSSLKLERSIANSAGIIGRPDAHMEWVRPGLMLYGMSPLGERSSAKLGLRPAMTLSAPLIAMRRVQTGATVGYGGLWRAQRESRIGIVAIGYGDGYPRTMHNGAPVLVDDNEASVAGRVSMDMIAVDITHLPNVKVGSQVILWGTGLPAERVASFADTLAYELVCRVTGRVAVKRVDG